MRFLDAVQWEFVHRVPMIVLLVAAVWYWAQGKRGPSIACALGGAIAGPLLAQLGSAAMGAPLEAIEVPVMNAIIMSLLHLLLVAYLGTDADWSNWRVDLGLGGLAGLSLTVAQGIATRGASLALALWPSLALGAGGALVLLVIRRLKGRSLALALGSAAPLGTLMAVAVSTVGFDGWARG